MRLKRGGLVLAALTALLAGCTPSAHDAPPRAVTTTVTLPTTATTHAVAPVTPSAMDSWAASWLARMSLRERIGQMFVTYAYGSTVADSRAAMIRANEHLSDVPTADELVRRYHVGGIVYLDSNPLDAALADQPTGNLGSPQQTRALSAGLQQAAQRAGAPPLLIATDQEQGLVTRIRSGMTLLPGNMALGADGDPVDAERSALVTGEELRAVGLNVDFAPVVDVNSDPRNPVIGSRSFGADPARVALLAAAAVRGYSEAGVAATAKHFPGHGDTSADSHYTLPTIEHGKSALERTDLPPFVAAIRANVPMVMVGHLLVPGVDTSEPSSLSPVVVQGLLRERLGFGGVAITDGLWMAAVRARYSDADVAVRAVLAGEDLLLMPPHIATAIDAILGAVRTGRIPAARIDQSVLRILRMKWQLAHTGGADPAPALDTLSSPAHLALAQQVAARSVTLLRSACGLLPLRAGEGVTIRSMGVSSEAVGRMRAALAQGGISTSGGPTSIVLLGDGIGRVLPAPDRLAVVLSMAAPYDLEEASAAGAWLAGYSDSPATVQALASVLTGRAAPQGRTPVPVPSLAGPTAIGTGAGLGAIPC